MDQAVPESLLFITSLSQLSQCIWVGFLAFTPERVLTGTPARKETGPQALPRCKIHTIKRDWSAELRIKSKLLSKTAKISSGLSCPKGSAGHDAVSPENLCSMVLQMSQWCFLTVKGAQHCSLTLEYVSSPGFNNYHQSGLSGGPVVKNLPCNAGDTCSIPGPARFHMLQGN